MSGISSIFKAATWPKINCCIIIKLLSELEAYFARQFIAVFKNSTYHKSEYILTLLSPWNLTIVLHKLQHKILNMLEPESVQIQTEGTKAVNSSACRLAPLATVMWRKLRPLMRTWPCVLDASVISSFLPFLPLHPPLSFHRFYSCTSHLFTHSLPYIYFSAGNLSPTVTCNE